MAKHNRGAFSPDDVEDAKRGHPDFDLREYAAKRDLEFLNHGTPAGLRAAMPCDEGLQSNVIRGKLPGGAYGVVAHEGLEIPCSTDSPDWGGEFYGVRLKLKGSLNPLGDSPQGTMRVPCTIVGTRVPETAGTHPYIRIDTRRSSPPFSFTNRAKLDDGWSVWCEPKPDPTTVEELATDPVGDLLRQHSEDGLFQAVVWWGTLVVRRNGFLNPDELDELARAAATIGRRLRDVCLPLADPKPFVTELPPPQWKQPRSVPAGFHPGEVWRKWALETAERDRLAVENPFAYHGAFPSLPAPGTAYVVLHGDVPEIGAARIAVHREGDDVRAVVLTAAPGGAKPTPPGGIPFPDHAARLEIADGLRAVWGITSWSGYSILDHMDEFRSAAAAVIRESS